MLYPFIRNTLRKNIMVSAAMTNFFCNFDTTIKLFDDENQIHTPSLPARMEHWGPRAATTAVSESVALERRTCSRPLPATHAGREGENHDGRLASHPAAGHTGLPVVERNATWRRPQRHGNGVPHHHEHGCVVGRCAGAPGLQYRQRRGTCQKHGGEAGREDAALSGVVVLDAEYQHLPRPALGTRTGDLRRRPVPHGTDGTSRCARSAGGRRRRFLLAQQCWRWEIHEDAGLCKALRHS